MKPDLTSENKPLLKPAGRWTIVALIVAALTVSGAAFQYVSQLQQGGPALSDLNTTPKSARAISALGHLRPEGEVVYLSGPTTLTGLGSSRVAQLLVKEGDRVKPGQVVAVLDSLPNLQAALKVALEEVKVAQANLVQVRAGAKTGEIEAQRATIANLEAELQGQIMVQNQAIARLKAELSNSQIEYQRYLELFANGATTASQLDSKRLTMTTTQEQLDEAKVNRSRIETTFQQQIRAAQATLKQIAEVRPADVQAAQAEIDRATANAVKAKADLDLAYVRATIKGQVLKIHTRSGETVGDRGIVALGQTDQMNVIAEVYESDVSKLQIGQTAKITSTAFTGEIYGTIEQIGLQVNPQEALSTDPTANVDSRIVEAKIRLNTADSQRVSSFTNLQVAVVVKI